MQGRCEYANVQKRTANCCNAITSWTEHEEGKKQQSYISPGELNENQIWIIMINNKRVREKIFGWQKETLTLLVQQRLLPNSEQNETNEIIYQTINVKCILLIKFNGKHTNTERQQWNGDAEQNGHTLFAIYWFYIVGSTQMKSNWKSTFRHTWNFKIVIFPIFLPKLRKSRVLLKVEK